MGVHVPLDYLLVTWDDGRVRLETPAPVTLEKRLALSVLLQTADGQASLREETPC